MREPALEGYAPGPWPCEDGGPRRTQIPGATPGLGMREDERLVARSRTVPGACMVITREPREVFVQGHRGSRDGITAWVERIDPESLEPMKTSPDLDAGPFWPGGLAAHRNGSLYVTCGRLCHRLDPDCQPVASRMLPRERPYNSLLVLPDGHLVMKDFGGGMGATAMPAGFGGSEVVVLEPERLEIVARLVLPEGSIARLSADVSDAGTARVYVIGDRNAMRLEWHAASAELRIDEAWTTPYLRFDGQSFGWDAVIEDGSAWFLDNGEGTQAFGPSFHGKGTAVAPLHLVRIPLDVRAAPEPAYLEICGKPGGIIANPPVVDASRKIAVGYDSGNGVMTAWRYGAPGEAAMLWQRQQDHAAHMVLFPDPGELVTNDYDHAGTGEHCVVLNIETGEERGRAAISSPVQSVVFPAAGWDRGIYATTFTTVARVSVE